MKLENASSLDAFRVFRYGPSAVFYREDPIDASPLEAFFRVADAYSGDWLPGTYVRLAACAAVLGSVSAVTAEALQPALGAAVRTFLEHVEPGRVDQVTPPWALAEILAAQSDSHAKALSLHVASLPKRGSNRVFLLDCIAFSLAMWAHSEGRDDALIDALLAIHEALKKQDTTNAAAA